MALPALHHQGPTPLRLRGAHQLSDEDLWDRAWDACYGSTSEAAVLIDEYLRRCPEDPDGLLLLTRQLTGERNFALARSTFAAIEPKPDDPRREDWLDEWIDFCELVGDHGRREGACRELTSVNPEFPRYWLALGDTLRHLGKDNDAERAYRHATTLRDGTRGHVELADLLRAQNRLDEAEEAFRRALVHKPDSLEAKAGLADIRTAKALREAPALSWPFDEEADWQLWCHAHDAVSDADIAQAEVLLELYEARCPDDPRIPLLRAQNLAARRRYDEAQRAYRACEPDKDEAHRLFWLSSWAEKYCQHTGKDRLGEEALREAVEHQPHTTIHWVFLGCNLARQGRLDEAAQIHSHGTTLEGDPDEAYLNLAYVRRAQRRFHDAEAALLCALKIEPHYPEARAALADVRGALAILAD